jgi:prevent-host-death family protein
VNVNVHQAKTHLSRLLDKVALGGEVVIAKAGKPVARLVPFNKAPVKRVLGTAKGDFVVPDDFDAPLALCVKERGHGRTDERLGL